MSLYEDEDGRRGPLCADASCSDSPVPGAGISRRGFLGGLGGAAGIGGVVLVTAGRARAASTRPAGQTALRTGRALRVRPALVWQLYRRRRATSWRGYGGLHTAADVDAEAKRIEAELKKLAASADFAMEVLPLARVGSDAQAAAVRDSDCDVILVYASGGHQRWLETLAAAKKPNVMFLRHKSGPIYLWYEIAHWRFLRKSEDAMKEPNMDVWDIVVDDYAEVLWRLRSLYGLTNTLGTKVVALGGLQAYSRPGRIHGPAHAKKVWKFGIKEVPFQELDQRLKKARADEKVMKEVGRQTDELLAQKGVSLHTDRKFVVSSFLAARVFKEIMAEAGATSVGVGHCMGGLIRITQTPPCLVLGLLNDEGLTAFCHCDFTHTPPGILRECEPMKIVTHFESDYGAAPKVMFRKGQVITTLLPNLSCTKWIGFRGTITDSPSYDICRSQIDMKIDGDWRKLLTDMEGFHTVTCYGDYLREVGYALKKLGIAWQNLSEGTGCVVGS